jgi:hypothetical protein
MRKYLHFPLMRPGGRRELYQMSRFVWKASNTNRMRIPNDSRSNIAHATNAPTTWKEVWAVLGEAGAILDYEKTREAGGALDTSEPSESKDATARPAPPP